MNGLPPGPPNSPSPGVNRPGTPFPTHSKFLEAVNQPPGIFPPFECPGFLPPQNSLAAPPNEPTQFVVHPPCLLSTQGHPIESPAPVINRIRRTFMVPERPPVISAQSTATEAPAPQSQPSNPPPFIPTPLNPPSAPILNPGLPPFAITSLKQWISVLEEHHQQVQSIHVCLHDRIEELEHTEDIQESKLDELIGTVNTLQSNQEKAQKDILKLCGEMKDYQNTISEKVLWIVEVQPTQLIDQIQAMLKKMEDDLDNTIHMHIATNAIAKADAVQGLLKLDNRSKSPVKIEGRGDPMNTDNGVPILPAPEGTVDPHVFKRHWENDSSIPPFCSHPLSLLGLVSVIT